MVESCPEDPSTSCCGPHLFTSVLLGVLACVLMTGGVFLAFHRWDPLWLIVSGVGVILVLIGSILHCCRGAATAAGKGCCLPADLHNHVVLNGGSLTEQLLPLSNARSVSQLSLNMLPGYFPPMVTAYGIEQHSAVVQNINRIIQQQSSQSAASVGKNFILLSLPPGNATQTNLQNLVATVYQLDGSVLTETSTDTPSATPSASTSAVSTSAQSNIPVFKNAEVQTCAAWSVPNTAKPITSARPSTSNSTDERSCLPISTRNDDVAVAIDLMHCLPNFICDTSCNNASSEVTPSRLVDISEERTQATEIETHRNSLIDNPDPPINSLSEIQQSILQPPRIPISALEEPFGVLVDVSEDLVNDSAISTSTHTAPSSTESAIDNIPLSPTPSSDHSMTGSTDIVHSNNTEVLTSNSRTAESSSSNSEPIITSARLDHLEESFRNDNSENSSLVDDAESLGRSSPPPSYEDVALQRGNPLALAYGTL